jgi:hypothetical protein
MLEKCNEPIAPFSTFLLRLFYFIAAATLVLSLGLGIGILGLHYIEGVAWLDAFCNAALILSDMGPVTQPNTPAGQLFLAFYALFSGLAFVSMVGVLFVPVVHRLLHIFHSGPSAN